MKKIYYILIFIFLVSCTSNTIYEKPKDLIPKDTMTNLLTDLYLASSASNIKNINLEIKVKYMPLVYDKYLIDSLRFKKSNIYYLSNIDEYSILLNNVKDSLVLLGKKYKKKDSLILIEKKYKKKEKLKKLKQYIKSEELN